MKSPVSGILSIAAAAAISFAIVAPASAQTGSSSSSSFVPSLSSSSRAGDDQASSAKEIELGISPDSQGGDQVTARFPNHTLEEGDNGSIIVLDEKDEEIDRFSGGEVTLDNGLKAHVNLSLASDNLIIIEATPVGYWPQSCMGNVLITVGSGIALFGTNGWWVVPATVAWAGQYMNTVHSCAGP